MPVDDWTRIADRHYVVRAVFQGRLNFSHHRFRGQGRAGQDLDWFLQSCDQQLDVRAAYINDKNPLLRPPGELLLHLSPPPWLESTQRTWLRLQRTSLLW